MQFISPPNKIMRVGNMTGDPQLAIQQPTNWAIWDEFDLNSGLQAYNFFEEVNAKPFPFTNLSSNRLAKNQSINVQRFSLAVVTYALNSGVIIGINKIETLDQVPAGLRGICAGYFSLVIGTTEVLQKYPLLSCMASFNKSANFIATGAGVTTTANTESEVTFYRGHSVHEFSSAPVITPDVEFKCPMQFGKYTAPAAGTYLRLTLEGFGTVQQNYGTI